MISDLDIDWSLAEVFYKDISADSTLTFSNLIDGKGINVILTNTSGSAVVVTLPSGIYKESGTISIAASTVTVFSLVRANSNTYMSALSGLTNA